MTSMAGNRTTYQLAWPGNLDERAVHAFFRGLAAEAAPGPAVIETYGAGGVVVHTLTLPTGRSASDIGRLSAVLPGVRADRVDNPLPPVQRALRLKLSTRRRALRTDHPADTALAILAALAHTRRHEVLRLQWVLGPRLRPVAIPNDFMDFRRQSRLAALLVAPIVAPSRLDPEPRAALRAKQSITGWRAIARLGSRAADPQRERQLLRQLLAALRTTEAPGLRLNARATPARKLNDQAVPWIWPSVLNELEVVGLSGWPLGEVELTGLKRSPYAVTAVPRAVPRTGRVVGVSTYPGTARPLALNLPDAARHAYLLGPTGVGKSTLMARLALADAESGRAVVLVDSKRDLVDDVLARLPEHRLDDVVVLDPSDTHAVVGLNPLRGPRSAAPLLADRLVAIFRQLFGDNLGPRSEDILHAGLLTLALSGGQTLAGLPLLYSHAGYRRRLVAVLDEPLGLGTFWTWFEGISDAERRQAVAPLMNKLRAFLLRPAMRRTLGQAEPRFSVRQVFTERKLLLVNLAKGDLGPETAQLFGALVLNEVWQHTLSRATIPPSRRHPVMVYVDEFQEYLRLPTPLGEVLAAARGYGVGLTIANQHLDQLTPDVRSAVLGNAGSRIIFRVNEPDASQLARDSRILTAEDFRGLGAFEAYASLMVDGARTPYASIATQPLDKPLRNPARLRKLSAARWGTTVEEVDRELGRLITGEQTGSAARLGRRPRNARSS